MSKDKVRLILLDDIKFHCKKMDDWEHGSIIYGYSKELIELDLVGRREYLETSEWMHNLVPGDLIHLEYAEKTPWKDEAVSWYGLFVFGDWEVRQSVCFFLLHVRGVLCSWWNSPLR